MQEYIHNGDIYQGMPARMSTADRPDPRAAHPARRYSSALEFARAIQAVQASMGVPVTPVDVLTESEDHTAYGTEHREPGSIDSGWLLGDSGSMLTAGYTMGMSSLTGGYTFHDTMSPAFDPTPPGMSTGAPGPGGGRCGG